MRPSSIAAPLVAFASFAHRVVAQDMIESRSLNTCMERSGFTASLFNVRFTPNNGSLAFNVVGSSTIAGNVTAVLEVIAYGYSALNEFLDPCTDMALGGLCPMNTGQITLNSNLDLPQDLVNQIPGIAYTVPDLDGKVRIHIARRETGEELACVEAELSNGKTVAQKGVSWSTAVIAGLALLASAITSGLGHSNTAAHVAANAMSLFGFFQAQAYLGMTAVNLPPIAASWTQNFIWSMGIIRVGFIQDIATWYQRATGGTPSTVLDTLATTSVEVQKRSLNVMEDVIKRSLNPLTQRSNIGNTNAETLTNVIVRGIERVGFRAHIELTNIFLTGYIFFVIFVVFVLLCVLIFKGVLELLARTGKMKGEKFADFRQGWLTVLKGILFRIVLIGFPQMAVLCFWEFRQADSPGEVALAVFTIFSMIIVLSWASVKVIRIAQRSIALHKSPAYILYSDPVSLNKWGFLYVQFRAKAYYWIVPILVYILVKGMFVGLAQSSPLTQAIAFVILEAALLIAVSVMRPYMDKKTNAFNISIAAVNFVSAVFLLIFTEVFDQPGLVTGIIGVIFFIMNAAFALILLLMVLISSIIAIVSKNPESRYQPMRDDRGSFIKSQTQLTTELDALGATARGDTKDHLPFKRAIDGDEEDSLSGSDSIERQKLQAQFNEKGLTPAQPESRPRTPRNMVEPSGNGPVPPRHNNPLPNRGTTASPARLQRNRSPGGSRAQNNASPWQRGAGYDR